jgi:hypothetical protein
VSTAARVSPARNLFALAGITIGAAGFTATLTGTYLGMRDFMTSGTGFCATGGPYEIASECPPAAIVTAGSIFGVFVFWAAYASITAWANGPVLASSLSMWGALFGLLGWNFMDFGYFNSESGNIVWGWASSGVVFWLMALGGLVPAVIMTIKWFTSRNEPQQPLWSAPLVRAAVGAPLAAPAPKAPPTVPARLVLPHKGMNSDAT